MNFPVIFWGAIVLFILFGIIEWWLDRGDRRAERRRRWPANLSLFAISIGLAAAFPVGALSAAVLARAQGLGLMNLIEIPAVLSWALSFLSGSIVVYAVHYSMHKVEFLWRIHSIHHSDDAVDVTTAFRQHPLSDLILAGMGACTAFLLGLVPEAVALHLVLFGVLNILHHSSLPWPPTFEYGLRPFIITKGLHHYHHSDYAPETNSNFSGDLALWDRLFGTYRCEPARPPSQFQYGLDTVSRSDAANLDSLLLTPFRPLQSNRDTPREN